MNTQPDVNPFFTKGFHGAKYFCGRETETRKLLAAVKNGRDVTLMAPRRYGKTGLIHNAFSKLDRKFTPIYLDILHMTSLAEFTRALSSLVVSELATPLEKTGKGIMDFFRSCRPVITPQDDGSVSFSFDVSPSKAEMTLRETFRFLESRSVKPVVAIDEFQQVRLFPEPGVEAALRSHIQFCSNTRFIFAGSQQHLMQEMFALPIGPFYHSTQLMSLDTIPAPEYETFAKSFFSRAKKTFSSEAFATLYSSFGGVTWYLQAVLNRIWESPEGLTPATLENAVSELAGENSFTYTDLLNSQTSAARQILFALAHSGGVPEISAKPFLERYRLPSASTVRSSTAELVKRSLVYRSPSGYRVYDRLFAIWLKSTLPPPTP